MHGFTNLRLKWPTGAFRNASFILKFIFFILRFTKHRFIKNNMCLLTYRIHVRILLIIIFIHGRFVIALEIASSFANNAPVDTVE